MAGRKAVLWPVTRRIRACLRIAMAGLLVAVFGSPAFPQGRPWAPGLPTGSPFLRGVPDPSPSAEPLRLSFGEAIRRALDHNLGAIEAETEMAQAAGARRIAFSELLPNVNATLSDVRRKTNLEAFGFPLGPGFPRVVGPYNVVDARLTVTQTAFDLSAIKEARAESHNVAAAGHSYRSARETVVLVAANLYLQTLAFAVRAEASRAQLATAEALYTQAQDLKQSGIIAGLDVIRADVRLRMDRQRRTEAENDFEKSKLQLARVIGLPLGQVYSLSDQLPSAPVPETSLDDALALAYRERPDFLAAQERVRAAEARRASVAAEVLPSLHITADYGAIGLTRQSALPTFSVMGAVDFPIFQGGRTNGRLLEADADLRRRRAEADDVRGQIDYDVRAALLDLKARSEQLQAAVEARALAGEQLEQSRDRFAAGVVNNVEVIQAQEAVALADEQQITALFGFNVSKALLAQAQGSAEQAVQKYFGGSTP